MTSPAAPSTSRVFTVRSASNFRNSLSSAMVCTFGVLTLVRACVAGGRGVVGASVAAVSMFEA